MSDTTDTGAKRPGRPPGPCNEREIAARRANAQHSTGPRTEAGKAASSRNSWKHGMHSAVAKASFRQGADSLAQLFGKPCRTTCPIHPDNPERAGPACGLVLDGVTNAGGNCLDKTVYVNAFSALMDALAEGSLDGMHGVLAAEGAAMLEMLGQIRAEIARNGLLLKIPVTTKEGKVVTDAEGDIVFGDYKPNPLLPSMILLFDKLGISLPELLATPQARSRAKTGESAAETFSGLLGGIMQRAGQPAPPQALPAPLDDDV